MAIKLNTAYSKKLGLPGFSSHAFSASVETELGDINQVNAECAHLYGLLQASVDHEIRNTGFVPDDSYGMSPAQGSTANGSHHAAARGWSCSPKQRDLILRIIDENGLAREDIEGLAHQRFGAGLALLNKLQASGLIDELLESYGGRGKSRGAPAPSAANAANGGGR